MPYGIEEFARLGAGIGEGLIGAVDAYRTVTDDRERRKREAQRLALEIEQAARQADDQKWKQAERLRGVGADYARAGDLEGAYRLGSQSLGMVGLKPPELERQRLEHLGPLPPGQEPTMITTDRPDYDSGVSRERILGMVGVKPNEGAEYFNLSPGEVRYKVGANGAVSQVAEGPEKPVTQRDPRYAIDPVSGEVKPLRPGVTFGVKPDNSGGDLDKAYSDYRLRRAQYVADWIALRSRNNTKIVRGPNGMESVRVPVTDQQIEQWRQEAGKEFDLTVPPPRMDPFRNPKAPGGTAAQPAGKKGLPRAQRSSIPVPAKYEDTALLPAWEGYAQEALALAPGAEISSRARSEQRNRDAQGAADSWHKHRQAFDLVKYKPADKARLKAWANSKGLYMLDEGDHLHFQPVQGVDADTAPRLAAFYQKHGIKPQEA